MTCLHLYANYKAVTSLVFETLNKDRLLLLLHIYCVKKSVKLPTPQEINAKESPFLGFGLKEKQFCGKNINLGASLKQSCENDEIHVAKIQKELSDKKFSTLDSKGNFNCFQYPLTALQNRFKQKVLL